MGHSGVGRSPAPNLVRPIIEEHAKLEWMAPAIDGRVCRIWSQIVLNTPRPWAHLEINDDGLPTIGEIRSWLRRSDTAPLHIRIDRDSRPDESMNERALYGLLSSHHRSWTGQILVGTVKQIRGTATLRRERRRCVYTSLCGESLLGV